MKKIILSIFLLCGLVANSQNTHVVTTKITHGDTSYLLSITNSFSLDSVFRKEYQYHDQCDSTLVNDTMRWVCVTITDSIQYWYKYRTFTGLVKDSVQLNLIPHKTINNTTILGIGDLPISGGGISQTTLNDTANAIRTTVNGKSPITHNHVYADITDPPTIPTNTNQLTNGAGFLVAADITGKANLASPTFTGTVSGITATMVGLGNVNNTSDASKPVSTAQQTALDLKQNTISLTTTGTSGAATFNGTTLNVPNYATGGNSPTFVNLASNFSSTSVTEAAVTGWSFAVTSGKTYRIEVIADYQTAATTTGGELGFFLSASAVGTIRGFAEADVVNTAAATGLKIPIRVCTTADATGSFLISTGVTAINTPHSFHAIVTFTCTISGTFNVGWATEVATSASQLNANSSLIYQALD